MPQILYSLPIGKDRNLGHSDGSSSGSLQYIAALLLLGLAGIGLSVWLGIEMIE